MSVRYECDDVEIAIDGKSIYVNGERFADFHDDEYARDFSRFLDGYGDAMYAEGYAAAMMEASAE